MIKLAQKNLHLVAVVALAVGILGAVSFKRISRDLLPIFTTPAVQIVTFYPGMPPEVMERDIMSRLQRWTGQSVGIEHQEGKAMLGVTIVKDFFREDISLDTAMAQVTSYAMSDMFYLPPGTIPPMIMPFDPTASKPLCLVSVSSPTLTEKELYDTAYYELRNRLQSIQGVIAPAVYGGVLRRILAYVDPQKLMARGLAPLDVVHALRSQNVLIPAGNLKAGDLDYQIITNAITHTVAEMNDIPLTVKDGETILLRDVAKVEDSHQIQSNIVRINGRRQVYIPIYRQPGANTIEIVDAIRSRLSRILTRLREMDPKNSTLALEVVLDQSTIVRESVSGLQIAAGLGALLAGLVVFIFLRNLAAGFIVWLSIPLALLAAVLGLYFTGQTLNAMTLGGLALAVGILVDQSIVVIDNILRHRRAGASADEAALKGTQEVSGPVLASTITFVLVFLPVLFLSGIASYLFRPLALSATLAICASLICALTLVPAACRRLLRKASAAGSAKSDTEGGFTLPTALALGIGGLLVIAGALMVPRLGGELFPRPDTGEFKVLVRLPSGTRIERTEETVKGVEQIIIDVMGEPDPEYPKVEQHKDSDLKMLISNIGVLMDWPAAYTPNAGPMDAFMLIQRKGKSGRRTTPRLLEELRKRLNSEYPTVEFSFQYGGVLISALNFGDPNPIHFQVRGSKLDVGRRIAEQVLKLVSEVDGVRDPRIAQRLDYPILNVEIDRQKAKLLGIDVNDIVKNLVTATNSSINFDPAFWIDPRNGNHYFIGAQYPEELMQDLDTLLDIPVRGSGTEKPTPLRNLVTVNRSHGPAVINHRNITRVTDIYADVGPGVDILNTVERIRKRLVKDGLLELKGGAAGADYNVGNEAAFGGKGYTLSLMGEIKTLKEAGAQFGNGLILAAILVFLALVAQFRSFLDPLLVLLTVPVGLAGSVITLWASGTPLSIPAFMGAIMVVGIVVEYSILLVEFANVAERRGAAPDKAMRQAVSQRLTPILMTSLTTLLSLLPMAIGLAGGEANAPLARVICGGVVAGTIATLIVIPPLYPFFKRGDRPNIEDQIPEVPS